MHFFCRHRTCSVFYTNFTHPIRDSIKNEKQRSNIHPSIPTHLANHLSQTTNILPAFKKVIFIISLFAGALAGSWAQTTHTIEGSVFDENKHPLEFVNIAIKGTNSGTTTNNKGVFFFRVQVQPPFILQLSSVGYEPKEIEILSSANLLKPLQIQLHSTTVLIKTIEVSGEGRKETTFTRINPKLLSALPDASGSIEGLIKTQIGVSSNNELSSQYRVRGGNFDENLVYVNDIEIYRPFLVKSGQQEGFSFVNPNLVSALRFSPGGFDAGYGDKMSSVLDIHYKRPHANAASAEASLLGASGHFEGVSKNHKFTHITGIRYKTNQYLLGTLDTKGDYKPSFFDLQSFLSYQISTKWSLEALGYYSQNNYQFFPTTRETSFGTISDVKTLTIYFDGGEKDRFLTAFGAAALHFRPNPNHHFKITVSSFQTKEEENYDISGEYWLQELDPVSGELPNSEESVANIGIGKFIQHARNELYGEVYNAALKGIHQHNNHRFSWEVKFQTERFKDRINEWEMRDSAGYSIPHMDGDIVLSEVYKARMKLTTNRYSVYVMDDVQLPIASGKLSLNAGIRLSHWDFNNETLFSPRINLNYDPQWNRNVQFRFATGLYYQPPFYKELRNQQGALNKSIKAQKSIHLVMGSDYFFDWKERPFKFTAELYYKQLSNLISYQIDNVRIRYSGDNDATGYATGIDLKLNGEFVPGIESWVALSLMKTEEDILNDERTINNPDGTQSITSPGYIPRPSDQRLNFSLFFQDYLPRNPSFKVHLNTLIGTGLPFGPPKSQRYQATYRTPAYRRVDIGFSKELTGSRLNPENEKSLIKNLWVGLEIFNLLNIDNTISHYWITDVSNRQYAVPNYLTSRRLNLQVVVNF